MPFKVGNIKRGGRALAPGIVVGADVCAGGNSAGNISNVDASGFWGVIDGLPVVSLLIILDTCIIGRRIFRIRGRNIRYRPNIVIKIVVATDM